MRLGDVKDSLKIDTIATVVEDAERECPIKCMHCGVAGSEGERSMERGVLIHLTRAQIKGYLLAPIVGTELQVKDLLAHDVNTNVDIEPLLSDRFADLAEDIHEMTEGESWMICVSHGLELASSGKPNPRMVGRLNKIVELIREGKISRLVLSFDRARHGGVMPGDESAIEFNRRAYFETMKLLRPCLDKVTVSIQGNEKEGHPLNRALAFQDFEEVKKRLLNEEGWRRDEFGVFRVNTDRVYAMPKGTRAVDNQIGDEDGDCTTIPDPEFERKRGKAGHAAYTMRGFLDSKGQVWKLPMDRKRSYNDLTDRSRWERLDNVESGQKSTRVAVESIVPLGVPSGEKKS